MFSSSEIAFKIASTVAFREACKKASPILLEPMFDLEVVTPEDFMGAIIGDLNSRRGKVLHMSPRHNLQVVQAEVPLAELFGYATDMRSISQGRASFSMELAAYAVVPDKKAKEILESIGRFFS